MSNGPYGPWPPRYERFKPEPRSHHEKRKPPVKRKFADFDEVDDTRPALQRMYEAGHWSDLTVEASGGKLFKVHKTVVCPASEFFHAACTAGFRETHTSHVKVPESSAVVDAILRHFYEIPAPWTQAAYYARRLDALYTYFRNLLLLRVAADKYTITSMISVVEEAASALIQSFLRNDLFVNVTVCGNWMFTDFKECDFLEQMREEIVKATAELLPQIIEDDEAFYVLQGNAEYLRRTLLHKEGRTGKAKAPAVLSGAT